MVPINTASRGPQVRYLLQNGYTDVARADVTVESPTPPPTLSFSASPTSITQGQASTLLLQRNLVHLAAMAVKDVHQTCSPNAKKRVTNTGTHSRAREG